VPVESGQSGTPIEVITFGHVSSGGAEPRRALTPHALAALALVHRSASPERVVASTAIDVDGLVPDLAGLLNQG
jgi:hypothetical protein